MQNAIPVGFIFKWQELIGAFLGVFLPLLIWFGSYFLKRTAEKKEKRKEAIQLTEIYITQSINHSLLLIIQMEAFLFRIEERITELAQIDDDLTYFSRITNFPPIADISFNDNLLKLRTGSSYLHNKIGSAEHIIGFTNAAIRKFDTDFANLISRNESKVLKYKPRQQRSEYIWDLKWYSGIVLVVISDLKNNGLQLLAEAKVYNLKLMKDYKHTKIYYEKGEMDSEKMKKIDQLIETEVSKILNDTN